MSLSVLAKSTTPLSPVPHAGMYDRPAGGRIVSERIGGTAVRRAVVGPAERAAMRFLSRVWHPDPLPRKFRGIHPNSPAHHERVRDPLVEMSLSLPAKSPTPLSPVPHAGMYDRPAGGRIVSERIGGTAVRRAVVGPAE